MRRFVATICCLLVIGIASITCAQTIRTVTPDQATMAWDPCTQIKDSDGNAQPVPDGDTVTYQVFLIPSDTTFDRSDTEKILADYLLSEVAETQYTFAFSNEGKWIGGVRGKRNIQGAGETFSYSSISWADDPAVAPDPWHWLFLHSLQQPTNIRRTP